MLPERVCLHLARIQLPPTVCAPDGIDVACPLPDDMMEMLRLYAPKVLEDAVPVLNEEGIIICKSSEEYEVGKFEYSIPPMKTMLRVF
jgi:hypothetical protein